MATPGVAGQAPRGELLDSRGSRGRTGDRPGPLSPTFSPSPGTLAKQAFADQPPLLMGIMVAPGYTGLSALGHPASGPCCTSFQMCSPLPALVFKFSYGSALCFSGQATP